MWRWKSRFLEIFTWCELVSCCKKYQTNKRITFEFSKISSFGNTTTADVISAKSMSAVLVRLNSIRSEKTSFTYSRNHVLLLQILVKWQVQLCTHDVEGAARKIYRWFQYLVTSGRPDLNITPSWGHCILWSVIYLVCGTIKIITAKSRLQN